MQNHNSLSIAFSPCPNDTFIFNALVNDLLPDPGFCLKAPVLEDVETLNRMALRGEFDITKISFYAYGHVSERYALLNSGSALGRGCGPLLVAKNVQESCALRKIAIPGKYTTAAMLLQLYLPGIETVEMGFDKIMASVINGVVDAGVIIHESRFTYMDSGLVKVVDLGDWWEKQSGGPIPLGGIVIKKNLGPDLYRRVDLAIRRSLQWAKSHKDACLPYIKKHSQELSDQVVKDHIGLYVNDYSENLGAEGLCAVQLFLERGRKAGLFSRDFREIRNFSPEETLES